MAETDEYPKAFKEVDVILSYMHDDDVKLIPMKLKKMIRIKEDKKYNFIYDEAKDLQSQTLLKETKVILAYIYMNYWATIEQKHKVKQVLNIQNEKDDSNIKKVDKVNDNFSKNKLEKHELSDCKSLVKISKKESFLNNILKRIKNFFKIKKTRIKK